MFRAVTAGLCSPPCSTNCKIYTRYSLQTQISRCFRYLKHKLLVKNLYRDLQDALNLKINMKNAL